MVEKRKDFFDPRLKEGHEGDLRWDGEIDDIASDRASARAEDGKSNRAR
jgi:hypothetical protein